MRGRIALVSGEAGIGKTALLRRFRAGVDGAARVLWAGCDPLFTPRPLAAVLELAGVLGGDLAARVENGAQPFDVATLLLRELAAGPSVLVLEDVHWADEATLDVIRVVGRRVSNVPVLLVLSYRGDGLDRWHPLRITLGDLPAGKQVIRLELAALTAGAVAELAAPAGLDGSELHRWTSGNPFFVTESLAAGTGLVPQSVRDAVLARAARLSGAAKGLLDTVAVVPGPADVGLLEALAPTTGDALDECLGAGIVLLADGRVEFRHEIARQVVEESLPPYRRVRLHRAALAALAGQAASGRVANEPRAHPSATVVARRLHRRGEGAGPRGPRPATAANPAGLTRREAEVLTLVAAGLGNAEIAARLVLSNRTVDNHVAAVFRKLGVHTRRDASAQAARLGMTGTGPAGGSLPLPGHRRRRRVGFNTHFPAMHGLRGYS
jgi:DNA-binding NarL/FixJ family response regulator